ncbi:hypothetical protein BC628DRAFT_195322 [Trametes gibbosa]|nr:hypothetical protein BC628DRAFT_195322 [Trametes gibbosa]
MLACNADKCKTCKHSSSRHIRDVNSSMASAAGASQTRTESVSDIVARNTMRLGLGMHSAAAGHRQTIMGLNAKVTDAEARNEMLSGFRPQGWTHISQKPSGSVNNRATKNDKKGGKTVSRTVRKADATKAGYEKLTAVGSVLIHPGGISNESVTESGKATTDLRFPMYPSVTEEEEFAEHGLFLTEDPVRQGEPLRFGAKWGPAAVNEWVRGLAPGLFEYMDTRYGVHDGPARDNFHWALVRRDHGKLVLVRKPAAVTGSDLLRIRGTGRSISSYTLRIVTRHYVPPAVYCDFEAATRLLQSGKLDLNDPRFSDSPVQPSSGHPSSANEDSEFSEESSSQGGLSDQSSESMPDIDFSRAKTAKVAMITGTKMKGKGKGKAIVISSDDEPDRMAGGHRPWTRARTASAAIESTTQRSSQFNKPTGLTIFGTKRARSESLDRDSDSDNGCTGATPKPKRQRLMSPDDGDKAKDKSDFDAASYLSPDDMIMMPVSPALLPAEPLSPPTTIPTLPTPSASTSCAAPPLSSAGPSNSLFASSRAGPSRVTPSPSPTSKYYLERAAKGLRSPGKLKQDPWA